MFLPPSLRLTHARPSVPLTRVPIPASAGDDRYDDRRRDDRYDDRRRDDYDRRGLLPLEPSSFSCSRHRSPLTDPRSQFPASAGDDRDRDRDRDRRRYDDDDDYDRRDRRD